MFSSFCNRDQFNCFCIEPTTRLWLGWWAASGCEAMVPESYLCRPLGPGVTCTCDRAGATLGCVQEARTQELGWPHWSTTEAILAVTLVLMLLFAAIRCVSIWSPLLYSLFHDMTYLHSFLNFISFTVTILGEDRLKRMILRFIVSTFFFIDTLFLFVFRI